jgi:hypothetical protein
MDAKTRQESLLEIVDKVTSLGLKDIAFTNKERGQLMDVLLWACDLLSERSQKTSRRTISSV